MIEDDSSRLIRNLFFEKLQDSESNVIAVTISQKPVVSNGRTLDIGITETKFFDCGVQSNELCAEMTRL